MANALYPLKFKSIYKQLIWGGERLREEYGKSDAPDKTGESWEISCVENNISVVNNGFLQGNNLQELIEVYMGDLVGDRIYDRFGNRFPILVKLLHSNEDLSIQVHPYDDYAFEHHGENGKNEMWYILEAEKDAYLIVGFKQPVSREIVSRKLADHNLKDILNFESVQEGDVFFIPAGRIHAIGPGIVLAEIQQTSNTTYRIYDWERLGADGNPRELHIEHSLNVLDYNDYPEYKINYSRLKNLSVNLVDSQYFTTQVINFDQPVDKDFNLIDSFVVYICTKGVVNVHYPGGEPVALKKGETILVPSVLKELSLIPQSESTLIEVYIK